MLRRRALPCRNVPSCFGAAILFVAFLPSIVPAEQKPPEAKDGKGKAATKLENEIVLHTRDGLELELTYYLGALGKDLEEGKGKKVIPIVLLHGLKQSRNDYKDLARALQKAGYAVIAPDLRGHGGSTHWAGHDRDDTIEVAKMTPNQFGLMITQDMRTVKDFLWQKNNAGEFNVDKLCVVGADMGASVALNFALLDWMAQERNSVPRPDYKVGAFVKLLVLISPDLSFRGLPSRKAIAHPSIQRDIAVMIVVGKQDAKAMSEAKRMHGLFAKSHEEPTGKDKLNQQTLVFKDCDTKLQGIKLLDPKFSLGTAISDFIQRRLVKAEAAKNWSWRERKVPYE